MDGGLWHGIGDREQDHPQKKEMQKSKMAVWGSLTNSCKKKKSQKQRRKGKICLFECRVPKNSKERFESLLQWSMQRNRAGGSPLPTWKLLLPPDAFKMVTSLGSNTYNRQNWKAEDFPILCQVCFGENPYIQMTKEKYGKECKICASGAPGSSCISRRLKCARPAVNWRMSIRLAS